jgi:hypothetical protein
MSSACSVAGCSDPSRARGWCGLHYKRWKRTRTTADPVPKAPAPKPACLVDGCENTALARGWCRTHYTRWYETGSTELGIRGPAGAPGRPRRPLEDRFLDKVIKTETCWLWTGGKTKLGYGSIWAGPGARPIMAHRASWEMYRCPIPDGLHIDHLCRVPSCVNPDHLEPVSRSENVRRGYGPNIAAALALSRQACPQGHLYDAENTYVSKSGSRSCKTCIRVRNQARRAAKRQGVPYVDPYLRSGDA